MKCVELFAHLMYIYQIQTKQITTYEVYKQTNQYPTIIQTNKQTNKAYL